MDVTSEVEVIGPGFRRASDNGIRMGYWTPELARWTDTNGFENLFSLIDYTYVSGTKITGTLVTASPVICVLRSHTAENDLTVSITGNIGLPTGSYTSGSLTITG